MSYLSLDDIDYAMEYTTIVHEPIRRINTFGTTNFEFQVLTEPMDNVGTVRIREGKIEAQKPKILKPDGYSDLIFKGFRDNTEDFSKWFKEFGNLSLLKYGFSLKQDNFSESILHDSIEAVKDRILSEIESNINPSRVVIVGVDDSWEISLIKFTLEIIASSLEINAFDLRRKGLM